MKEPFNSVTIDPKMLQMLASVTIPVAPPEVIYVHASKCEQPEFASYELVSIDENWIAKMQRKP